jgi:hypothetical protein
MRISELLRTLADTLDGIGNSEEQNNTTTHVQQIQQTNQDNQEAAAKASDKLGEFVPPLQAKLELLKKAVDVPNYYDEAGNTDELIVIKKNAGIHPAVMDEFSNDEPFVG